MKKLLFGALVAFMMLATIAVPDASAITDGELDGEDHPYVGMIAMYDGDEYIGRCSGALISSTVLVTAGHCTSGATTVDVYMGTDNSEFPLLLELGDGDTTGTPYVHPLYLDQVFVWFDLGIVVLDTPYELDEYAVLPEAGLVDTLKPGRTTTVTAVGYGLQDIIQTPNKLIRLQADRVRYQADLMIVSTKGVAGIDNLLPDSNSLFVSGDAKNGGTCFGDSGGPLLYDDNVLIAVTSFGLNSNCSGVGGMFRIDRDVELDWINSFLD